MDQKAKIPLINANNASDFHFGHILWKLPISASRNLFHINKLEDYLGKIKFPLPPHRKPVIDLIFLSKGKSIRYKGLQKYEFNKNQFFFLPAYQITSHEYMSKNVQGYYLHFSLELFASCSLHHELDKFKFLNFNSNPIMSIKSESLPIVLNVFKRLEELFVQNDSINYQLIAYYILCLLEEAKSTMSGDPVISKSASTLAAQQYQDLLSQYIYQKHKVSDFADHMHITPNHLNKCVKKVTNKTAQDLLNEMLILEAKSLLKYSHYQIAEIANKLGSQSPSNFTRFFKTQTGMSPTEYLKSMDGA